MIARRLITLETLMALVVISLFSSPVGAQLYFSDDFEDSAESAAKWEVITGDWQVADGVYHQLSTASPWQASMVSWDHWKNEWTDYTIEFKVKPLTEGDAPVNVLFRVQDPVPATWDDRNGPNTHMYRWIVNGWTNTESRPYIYDEGTATMLAQTNNSLEVGTWYDIKLVVTRTGLAGYVNDVEMFNVQHAEWTDGRVGIHAYSGMMDFDDFIVYGPLGLVSASDPAPGDGQTDVPRGNVLSWTPGATAVTHDVYLGTNFNDVNEASRTNPMGVLVSQGQSESTYDPGLLGLGQTYYWRIDEVNGPPDYTIFKGEVWSFKMEPFAYPIENVTVVASSSSEGAGPENTINGSGLDDDGLHSTRSSDMWLSDADGAQPTFIEFTFDRLYKLHEMVVWNYNIQFEALLGYGFKDVTVEYSENGADWVTLGDFEFAQATSREGYASNTAVDFEGHAARAVRLTANSNWGGMFPQYGLSEVRFMYVPTFARVPQPADGDTGVSPGATLSWRAGREAAGHEVYLGTDAAALPLAGTSPAPSLTPGALEFGKTYYWRVDEVNEAEAISVWESDLWTFQTLEYELIDGFETYTDDIDAKETIFDTWIDGWATGNGSTVGYFDAPFAEQTLVHSGTQSMPLAYDNSASPFYSEAQRDLGGMDWNVYGADTLRLFVYGQAPAFAEMADGTIVMNGIGADIWGTADEFRYVHKSLRGDGAMIARVDSLADSDVWAKGGVMIRETLDPGSAFAAVYLTGDNGVRFQARLEADASAVSDSDVATDEQIALREPVWVKIERVGNTFHGYYSTDGADWTAMAWNPQTIAMANDVTIGLALTSHNATVSTGATFAEVTRTGGVTGNWQMAEIGVAQPTEGNDPQPLYVAIEDGAGHVAVVRHPDMAIRSGWNEWQIPFDDLANVNLSDVQTMTIGLGDPDNPSMGGTGLIFIDDIAYGHPAAP